MGHRNLQYQLRRLRSQKATVEVGVKQLKASIAELEKATSTADNEWEKVVQLRQRRFEELKQQVEKGDASADQLEDAVVKLAEARAQLASQERSRESTSMRSVQLTELKQLRARLVEMESRLAPLVEALDKFERPEFQTLLASFPDVRVQEQNLVQELNDLNGRIAQIQRSLRISPRILITVLDGVADAPQQD